MVRILYQVHFLFLMLLIPFKLTFILLLCTIFKKNQADRHVYKLKTMKILSFILFYTLAFQDQSAWPFYTSS